MSGVIGRADEFYRARVMRLDETDVPDLDWRDDVLYRRTASEPVDERDVWRVEAVDVEDDENVTVLETFADAEGAYAWLETVETDLSEMTRSEFERTYFPGDEDSEAGPKPS